jgi:hypothetical protein
LARVTLIVVASASAARRAATTAGTSTPAARTAATPRSTAAEASAALGLGTRFINIKRAATEFLAVEGRDSFLSFGGIRHFDESKSARSSRVPVSDNTYLIDFSVRLKQRAQLGFGCAVGDVANEKLLHDVSFSSCNRIANLLGNLKSC